MGTDETSASQALDEAGRLRRCLLFIIDIDEEPKHSTRQILGHDAYVVGRKAWLFVAREEGGHWVAGLLGIFHTCRLQSIDLIAYLLDIMPAVITGDVDPLTITPATYSARHAAKVY